MEEILKGDSAAAAIFLFLLPGFLGLAVFDYLVEGEKRETFDKIVYALSVTLVSSSVVGLVRPLPAAPDTFHKDADVLLTLRQMVDADLVYVSAVAILVSVALAFVTNYGVVFWLFRTLRLTYKTSTVDVWQDLFYRYRGYWVRVTFSDGREVVGWPRFFSATGKPRELFLSEATWWLKDEGGSVKSVDVDGPGVYISSFDDVVAITLLE